MGQGWQSFAARLGAEGLSITADYPKPDSMSRAREKEAAAVTHCLSFACPPVDPAIQYEISSNGTPNAESGPQAAILVWQKVLTVPSY